MRKILIAGEGGQGAQSIAEILALSAHQAGKFSSYIPNFGVEQRGGVSLAFLQISGHPVHYPKFDKAEVLILMCNRAVKVIKKFIDEKTLVIFDSSFVEDEYLKELQGMVKNYLSLPAKQIAQDKFSVKATNMVVLGALYNELAEIPKEIVLNAINEKFAKHPEFKEQNQQAFEEGLKYATVRPDQEFKGLKKIEVNNIFQDEQKSWQRYPEYCKGCMLCAVRCPKNAISASKDLNFLGTPMPVVDIEKCAGCGMCQLTCPDGAIQVKKK